MELTMWRSAFTLFMIVSNRYDWPKPLTECRETAIKNHNVLYLMGNNAVIFFIGLNWDRQIGYPAKKYALSPDDSCIYKQIILFPTAF
jgi:hypothetical protein